MQTEHTQPTPAPSTPVVMTLAILRAHLILATFDPELSPSAVWFVPAIVGGWHDRVALPHLPLGAEPVPGVVEPLILHALDWRGQ